MRLSPCMIPPVVCLASAALAGGFDPEIPIQQAIEDGDVQIAGTADMPVEQQRAQPLDSGVVPNLGADAAVVFNQLVTVQDASWVRLYFSQGTELGPGSYIQMTSLADGEVQKLDAGSLALWSYGSAYFNGDTVKLELIAAPGTDRNRIVIDNVGLNRPMPQPVGGAGQCGICGATDDRVPSSEEWAARLFPAGCTASVYNELSCLVSAGHCVDGFGSMVIQFNVPNSFPNCATQNPPVADQFPVFLGQFNNNGPGDDWSVLLSGTNGLGQRPYERYGVFMPISNVVASSGTQVEVTGYGVDTTCTLSQTQQFASGVICTTFSNAYEFQVDIRGGNSGSSLVRTSDQAIIGIVTHCPCCNVATRITNSDFAQARAQECAPPTTTLPFTDSFPDFVLDPNLWPVVLGAEGSTRGINEPSPTRSLNCDATTEGGDQAQTAGMNTTSVPDLRMTYWYERTGFDDSPEDGEDLVVEYKNSSNQWVEINRHLGSGPDMTEYEPVEVEFPANAHHALFQVRFRAISFDPPSDNDDHFVDDVCIGSLADCPNLAPPCPWDCGEVNGVVDTVDFLALLSMWGQTGGACDFDNNGVDTIDFLALLAAWGPCPVN